jgi:zinc transporter ZupT
LTSLVGVLLLSFDKGKVEVIIEYMTSFAVGCLLGVVVFHLYPEGSEYLSDMEGWVTGVCVLVGIMLSLGIEQGIHLVLSLHGVDPCSHSHQHQHTHHPHDHLHVTISAETHERVFTPVTTSPNHTHHGELQDPLPLRDSDTCSSHNGNFLQSHEETGKKHQTFFEKYIKSLKFVQPVAWMTAIGDIIHAFTDGVVLAIAFKSCNTTVGWSVALGIVLHEVPHRVGDFFIFLKAGMCLLQAIVLNLIASMASLLGVVILLAAGSVSDHTLGILLSIGTGTLLFIALSELLPPMMEVRKVKSALLHFFFVSLGCVVIGLSLLHEKHCDAETGTVGGHNH